MEDKRYTKVGIYARVSKAEQKTVNDQIRICKEYCQLRDWQVIDTWHDEDSGANDNRINRAKVIAAYRQRIINVVLVWRMDRWSRSLKDLIGTIEDMQSSNTCFVSITEGLDLTNAAGRVIVHILGAFAQFERELIQERTKLGLARVRAQGQILGRPKVISQEIRDKVLEMAQNGISKRKIAISLGISRTNVQRFIRAGLPGAKIA